jgi:hypothetical protein
MGFLSVNFRLPFFATSRVCAGALPDRKDADDADQKNRFPLILYQRHGFFSVTRILFRDICAYLRPAF